MNKKLRSFLEANGLRKDATEQEAWLKFDALVADGVELPGIDPGTRSAASGAAGQSAAPAATPVVAAIAADPLVVKAEVERALAADAARRTEIAERLQVAFLTDADNGAFARSLENNPAITLEMASKAIFERLKTKNVPFGDGTHSGAEVGIGSRDKLRSAITDGLLLRSGHKIEKPADGSREFRGRHLVEICREMLMAVGISVRGLNNMEIVSRTLATGSTSDFPALLGALVNKNLLRAYIEWPQTWRPFVAIGAANDFKDIYAIKLSGSPDLKGLGENGEYQTAAFSDAKENYRLITKGIKVPLTRQMIINDDLRAFTRIPQLFGAAAKRMEADAVYSLITANGNMSDGAALFSTNHNNLAGTAAALASGPLGLARAAMRKQKGMKGELIDVTPAFLLVPVAKETDADVLLRSTALPTENMSAGVFNPWAGKLTPIADPHLDANSATAWYLLAHPDQVPTIEVAYLAGQSEPYVEEQIDFDSDALITKVRHDFGAGVVDSIGAYKNAGA